ncbi:hypothetical protein [Streptomyces sp. NPDC058812]|uniref:hypothetical protein n=1 Tax=unclassified Streptomyces TaxID=2593676 RepID=UPI0036CFFA8E
MSFLEAFGIVSGVASLIGLVLAVKYARDSAKKVKDLRYYSAISRHPVISQKGLEKYGVSIYHESPSGRESVGRLYIHYLSLVNLGHEPIRREDIAPGNPLRIKMSGGRILALSLESVTRDVIHFKVSAPSDSSEGDVTADISFDYLDFQDGGLIRIISTAPLSSLEATGDVVGMPTGVSPMTELSRSGILGKVGATLSLLLLLGSLSSTSLVYRWVTGAWEDSWVLLLPLAALFIPLVIILVTAATVWPDPKPILPQKIIPRRHAPRFYFPGPSYETVSSFGPHLEEEGEGEN